MKLCWFTTVGASRQTIILAFTLLKYEDKAQIEWAFRCFHSTFCVAPGIIFTDGAAAIATAIARCVDIWSDCKHLLCVFHISKNFWQHIHPLFHGAPEQWKATYNLFWRLAKVSDASFADAASPHGCCTTTVGGMWADMTEIIQQDGSGSTKEAALTWLAEDLYAKRFQWAAVFTWSNLTFGLHSTQRSEAIHSAINQAQTCHGELQYSIVL